MQPIAAGAGAVLVLGSINRDVVIRVGRHPQPGETVLGGTISELPGGKGANQAIASARAGAAVRMHAAVGDDSAGAELRRFLDAAGIDTTGIRTCPTLPTGTAFVMVADDGENAIVVVPGANGSIDVADAEACALHGGDVVVAQFETPVRVTERMFTRARSVGARCVLNPAPAAPLTDALLRTTSVLVVNEHELALTTGAADERVATWSAEVVRTRFDRLAARGFDGALVVTFGEAGVIGVTADGVHRVAGHRVDVVDTTGAGDCFVGYLAAELARGGTLDEAIGSGNAAAALCVGRVGAAPAVPTRAEVAEFLNRRPSTS